MKKKEKTIEVENICQIEACDKCAICAQKGMSRQANAMQIVIDEVKALYHAEAQSYFFHFTAATH